MKRRAQIGGALVSLLSLLTLSLLGSYEFEPQRFDKDLGGPVLVVDRNGELLRQVESEDGRPGRDAWVALADINSIAVQTLLASEDQAFYEHHGVDLPAIGRAIYLTASTSQRYGGSTITMQLARMVYLQGNSRTVWNKLLQIRAALGLERSLSKNEILEQYLNRAYYGRGAYGIDAAARRYFGKPAKSLSVGEASFLVVLPRNPALYDPIKHQSRALKRRSHLLKLLSRQGRLSQEQVERAKSQPLDLWLRPRSFEAPHFVDEVLRTLPEEQLRRGGQVFTTLDLRLQKLLERRTAEHLASIEKWDFDNAGAVVLDAQSAEVLAMVGSADYRKSQINITTWKRHPGSALKPFVYAAALEAGHNAGRIAYDVKDISTTYRMPNSKEHGPTSYRIALGSSYNFAAVHVIEQIGEESVMNILRRGQIASLPQRPQAYGSRLALGSTRTRLLDLTAGYRAFVTNGRIKPPTFVREVLRPQEKWRPSTADERQVVSASSAWITMDMLADPEARQPMFGHETPADFAYPVVAKTGTAEGFSDTVAVFATAELLVGAWAGRVDGGSTQGRAAMSTAAPLARAALVAASDGRPLSLPPAPTGVIRRALCPASGMLPGPGCKHRRHEWMHERATPQQTCSWHERDGALRYPARLQPWVSRTRLLAEAPSD